MSSLRLMWIGGSTANGVARTSTSARGDVALLLTDGTLYDPARNDPPSSRRVGDSTKGDRDRGPQSERPLAALRPSLQRRDAARARERVQRLAEHEPGAGRRVRRQPADRRRARDL